MHTIVDIYFDAELSSKADARYTPNGTAAEHCGICRHFHKPDVCDRIEGAVVAGGWCRFFAKKDG